MAGFKRSVDGGPSEPVSMRDTQKNIRSWGKTGIAKNEKEKQSALDSAPMVSAEEMYNGRSLVDNPYWDVKSLFGDVPSEKIASSNVTDEAEMYIQRAKSNMGLNIQDTPEDRNGVMQYSNQEQNKEKKIANLILKRNALKKRMSWENNPNLKVEIAKLNRDIKKIEER